MNVLQVTNKVLQRLREDQVTATDESEYSSLIAEFVADIHTQCCEEHDWSSMKHYINLPVLTGQREYNLGLKLENGGDVPNNEQVTNNVSHLVFDNRNRPMGFLFDDENDTQGQQLIAASYSDLEYMYQLDRQLDNQEPFHIAYRSAPENEGLELSVWPLPSVDRLMRLQFWTPPIILGDGTDDNTELLMPSRPVYLGALMLALNERGEEIGEPGNIAEQRFYRSLSSYIEADTKLGIRTDQYEAKRD